MRELINGGASIIREPSGPVTGSSELKIELTASRCWRPARRLDFIKKADVQIDKEGIVPQIGSSIVVIVKLKIGAIFVECICISNKTYQEIEIGCVVHRANQPRCCASLWHVNWDGNAGGVVPFP